MCSSIPVCKTACLPFSKSSRAKEHETDSCDSCHICAVGCDSPGASPVGHRQRGAELQQLQWWSGCHQQRQPEYSLHCTGVCQGGSRLAVFLFTACGQWLVVPVPRYLTELALGIRSVNGTTNRSDGHRRDLSDLWPGEMHPRRWLYGRLLYNQLLYVS